MLEKDLSERVQYHRDRSDFSAEKFRGLLQHVSYGTTAAIFAAILKVSDGDKSTLFLIIALIFSSISLLFIGLSWDLQKSKNLSLWDAASEGEQAYEDLQLKFSKKEFRNQYWDRWAFKFILIAFILTILHFLDIYNWISI